MTETDPIPRRREVEITPALRALVIETAEAIRAMLADGRLPPPVNDARCRECSLNEICEPAALAAKGVQAELRTALFDADDLE
jgi:CRISPR-associated exonuclease Cas4